MLARIGTLNLQSIRYIADQLLRHIDNNHEIITLLSANALINTANLYLTNDA